MSARAMVTRSGPQAPEERSVGQELLSNGLAPANAAGAPATEQPLSPEDESARFVEELLLRYGAPYPLPWRHGGLNE